MAKPGFRLLRSGGEPHAAPGGYRYYGWVVRRHMVAGGLAALPVVAAAKAAAAMAWNRPADTVTDIGRTDVVPFSVSVLVLVVGVTAWGLVEHVVVHSRAARAHAQTDPDGRWFLDQYGRWWYRP